MSKSGSGAYARRTDPWTSHAAAAKVDVATRQAQVTVAIREGGPGSTVDIALWLGVEPWSISPRMKPMEKKGLVYRRGYTHNAGSRRRVIMWDVPRPPKLRRMKLKRKRVQ